MERGRIRGPLTTYTRFGAQSGAGNAARRSGRPEDQAPRKARCPSRARRRRRRRRRPPPPLRGEDGQRNRLGVLVQRGLEEREAPRLGGHSHRDGSRVVVARKSRITRRPVGVAGSNRSPSAEISSRRAGIGVARRAGDRLVACRGEGTPRAPERQTASISRTACAVAAAVIPALEHQGARSRCAEAVDRRRRRQPSAPSPSSRRPRPRPTAAPRAARRRGSPGPAPRTAPSSASRRRASRSPRRRGSRRPRARVDLRAGADDDRASSPGSRST